MMVKNTKSSKPRGYAFVEFESERDMHCELIWEWKWEWFGGSVEVM